MREQFQKGERMRLKNVRPLISLAKSSNEKNKNFTLLRGYDTNGEAKYLVTSTYKNTEPETIGFFLLLEDAVKFLSINSTLENLKNFRDEHPNPRKTPMETIQFLNILQKIEADIENAVTERAYENLEPVKDVAIVEEPEEDNRKSLAFAAELEALVVKMKQYLRDCIS